jgi:hypothetical protein
MRTLTVDEGVELVQKYISVESALIDMALYRGGSIENGDYQLVACLNPFNDRVVACEVRNKRVEQVERFNINR